jgi:hypothetical protein
MSNWIYVGQFFFGSAILAGIAWISPFRPKHWCCRIMLLVVILLIMAHNCFNW